MKRLNIGFVFDDSMDKSDGVQQYILTLFNYFVSKGHNVYFFVGQTSNSNLPNLYSFSKNLKIKFNHNILSIPYHSLNYKKISKILDSLKIDVIHVEMPFSPLMSAKVIKYAYKNKIPVMGTFHILGYTKFQAIGTKLLSLLTKNYIEKFSKIYSISSPAQQFSRKYYCIDSEILSAPINIEKFKATNQLKNQKINILFLGRLVERKAPIDLLKAIKYMKEQHISTYNRIGQVSVAGSGYQEEKLKRFVVNNELTDKVRFLGYVSENEKIRLFQNSHISVFPSRGGESFGIVLIEALSSGNTLVLAANNHGYSSVLSNLPDQLFNIKDIRGLATKINWFIENPNELKMSLKLSRETVKAYDINHIGDKILSDMNNLVAKHIK